MASPNNDPPAVPTMWKSLHKRGAKVTQTGMPATQYDQNWQSGNINVGNIFLVTY